MYHNRFLFISLIICLSIFLFKPAIADRLIKNRGIDTATTYTINPDTLNLDLKVLYDTNGLATGIHVNYQLPAQKALNKSLALYLDDMKPVIRGQDTVRNLLVRDQVGTVTFLKTKNNNGRLEYKASRNVSGPVNIQYDILAALLLGRHGPHIDMQQSGGGITGSFISFLLLPDVDKDFFITINWKLKHGDQAISTFGSGNVKSKMAISRGELNYAQFILGKLFTYPVHETKSGFSVAGLGLTPEQIGNSIPAYEKTYKYMLGQLHGSPQTAFRFFFRSFDGGPLKSGSAVKLAESGSFVLYIPQGGNLKTIDVYNLVAHEMIHVFVKDAETDWYTEGIADYLSAVLPYRAGLTSKANYINLINNGSAAYYTNSIRLASDSAYNKNLKWTTANSWQLSYSRGMLYFANLDAKLSRLQGSHPTVLSLVIEMNKDGEAGGKASWETLLKKYVGEWAVADYRFMLSGKLLIPEPDAYGKGLTISKIQTGIFDLGHNGSRGSGEGQVIKRLDAGSNAAKAGLRNGDIITKTIDLSDIYTEYDKPITLSINRNGKILSITYLPHGELVEGYKWSAN